VRVVADLSWPEAWSRPTQPCSGSNDVEGSWSKEFADLAAVFQAVKNITKGLVDHQGGPSDARAGFGRAVGGRPFEEMLQPLARDHAALMNGHWSKRCPSSRGCTPVGQVFCRTF